MGRRWRHVLASLLVAMLSGWTSPASADSFLEFVEGLRVTGVIGPASNHFRPDAGIEIARPYTAGNGPLISIFDMTMPGTTLSESAVAMGAYDSVGGIRKTSSISTKWVDPTAGTGYAVLRFNATSHGGTATDVALCLFGNHGVSLFDCNGVGPGEKVLHVAGFLRQPQTVTPWGIFAPQTMTTPRGTIHVPGGATMAEVVHPAVTETSYVHAMVRTDDATAQVKNVVPFDGGFVIHLVAPAQGTTTIGFWVVQ